MKHLLCCLGYLSVLFEYCGELPHINSIQRAQEIISSENLKYVFAHNSLEGLQNIYHAGQYLHEKHVSWFLSVNDAKTKLNNYMEKEYQQKQRDMVSIAKIGGVLLGTYSILLTYNYFRPLSYPIFPIIISSVATTALFFAVCGYLYYRETHSQKMYNLLNDIELLQLKSTRSPV